MNVITRTGKEYPSDYFVEHQPSHSIYFRVQDVDLETAEGVFSDKDETTHRPVLFQVDLPDDRSAFAGRRGK